MVKITAAFGIVEIPGLARVVGEFMVNLRMLLGVVGGVHVTGPMDSLRVVVGKEAVPSLLLTLALRNVEARGVQRLLLVVVLSVLIGPSRHLLVLLVLHLN